MTQEIKDSGVNWIDVIPTDWEIVKLKNMFSFGKGLPITKENLTETGVPVISYGQIHGKYNSGVRLHDELIRYVPESYLTTNAESLVHEGDLILADTSEDVEGCGNCAYIDRNGQFFAGYHTIILKADVPKNNKYIAYLMQTDPWRSQIRSKVSGVKVFSISRRIISDATIILPPYDEQHRIVLYLDQMCAEIDSVIADTQRTIEEYKKLKQTIITEAVTKGIRGERPMKDSGIQGIGDIPEEWNTVGLKILCRMQSGKNITSEMIADEGAYPVYGGNGLRGYYSEYNTEGEYLLVGRQGALCGNVHHVAGQFWATEHAVVTTPTMLADIDFLYYLLIGMNLNQYANNTAAQPGLAVGQIQNVRTCFVPLAEQQEIASYLNKKCAEIEKLIAGKTHLLEELESYKKSVIYEYVTGKKEVPACQ